MPTNKSDALLGDEAQSSQVQKTLENGPYSAICRIVFYIFVGIAIVLQKTSALDLTASYRRIHS